MDFSHGFTNISWKKNKPFWCYYFNVEGCNSLSSLFFWSRRKIKRPCSQIVLWQALSRNNGLTFFTVLSSPRRKLLAPVVGLLFHAINYCSRDSFPSLFVFSVSFFSIFMFFFGWCKYFSFFASAMTRHKMNKTEILITKSTPDGPFDFLNIENKFEMFY